MAGPAPVPGARKKEASTERVILSGTDRLLPSDKVQPHTQSCREPLMLTLTAQLSLWQTTPAQSRARMVAAI